MLKSMTGYGIAENKFENCSIAVEIKSLNHRFIDMSVRMSGNYPDIEYKVRNMIKENVYRGKIDVFISIESSISYDINLNIPILRKYYEILQMIKDKFAIKEEINVGNIISFKDIIIYKEIRDKFNDLWDNVKITLINAIDSLNEMKAYEGKLIYREFRKRLKKLSNLINKIEKKRPKIKEIYINRLKRRIKEVNIDLEEDKIIKEILVYSERGDISEEISRLRGHIDSFNKIMNMEGPHGKRLDFLIQEMNREINTIGAKAINFSNIVIDVKNELERIREQVQNIE
jgi:uncharacterized protein (TIGR00255 family)